MLAIQVENLYKQFVIIEDKPLTLKDRVLRWNKKDNKKVHVVLEDINIKIEKGQVVGLIGRNGSGKSTLLKLLSRIIYPNKGSIKMDGRVTSLLELGAGFHPEFTGIENIYMNASLFGLTRKEIDLKMNEIIDFSELGDYINRPVRIYSSGMYMRLAFSIATIVDPDILLVDEVLAVGDAAFQQKCLNRIMDLKQKGKTIIIVAHDQSVMERLCDRCIWLKDGKIQADGKTKKIMVTYLADMNQQENNRVVKEEKKNEERNKKESENIIKTEPKEETRWGNLKAEIFHCDLLGSENQSKRAFNTSDNLNVQIQYRIHDEGVKNDLGFGVGIFRKDGIHCYGTNTFIDGIETQYSLEGEIKLEFASINLLPGEYWIDVAAHSEGGEPYHYIRRIKSFIVQSEIQDRGIARIPHEWKIN